LNAKTSLWVPVLALIPSYLGSVRSSKFAKSVVDCECSIKLEYLAFVGTQFFPIVVGIERAFLGELFSTIKLSTPKVKSSDEVKVQLAIYMPDWVLR
jgi:hypothetical protein